MNQKKKIMVFSCHSMETSCMVAFLHYLSQHHSCEDSLQVCKIMVTKLGHDASIQQHQLERIWVRPDADHYCVPQVSEGGLTMGLPRDTSAVTGTRKRPQALDQNVPWMEIRMDKVVHKNLEYTMEISSKYNLT